jgi:hypothetical protein
MHTLHNPWQSGTGSSLGTGSYVPAISGTAAPGAHVETPTYLSQLDMPRTR